jgi:hypothetical protein
LETTESKAVAAGMSVKFLGFWNRIDLQSRHVVSRIAWKTIVIFGLAATQFWSSWGLWETLNILLFFNGLLSCGIALATRERARSDVLTHWHEAILFLLLALLVRWIWL